MTAIITPPSGGGGGGAVSSVAGKTGAVNLVEGDIASLTSDLAAKLVKASNLSDVANAGTSRTNLGLGTAATHPIADFLQTANNLSDVTAGTARTNLGLGTAATIADATLVHLAGAETITGVKLLSAGLRQDSQAISTTATLVDGSQSLVLVDTTSAAFTLTLPASPSAGSSFIIVDVSGTWNTNNLTIGRNGKAIDGLASNITHITQYGIVEYLYDGTGWHSRIRQLSQATPLVDGTGTAGTAIRVTREDHVHPTDTSRAPTASPTFTGTVTIPTPTTTTGAVTKAYADATSPDLWTSNEGVCRGVSVDAAAALTGALLPYLYPIEPKGRKSFALDSLTMRVGTGVAAGAVGAAIYLITFSGSTFTCTRIAVIASAGDGTSSGIKQMPVTSRPITLDFVNNKYMVAGMVSTITTLTVTSNVVIPGYGCIRYTGSARSDVTDFPTTIDNNAGGSNNAGAVAAGGTRMPFIGLANSAGINWP